MRRTTMTAAAVAFGLGALATPGVSGPAQQDANWHELVLGIAHIPWEITGIDDPDVMVAELPDGFRERMYLPADATVHGSLVRPGGDFTVVATSTRSADDLWPEYEREMQRLGWRLPDEPSGLTRSLGDIALAWVFCGEGIEVALVTVTDSEGKTRLRIDRHAEYRSWHCARTSGILAAEPAPAPGAPRGRRSDDPDFFELRPPPMETRLLGACRDYSRFRSSQEVARSTMGRAELREHYESQLEEAGWARSTSDEEAMIILSSWERDGTLAVLLLAPINEAPGCWRVMFQQHGGIEALRVP